MTQGDITVGGIAPRHLHLPLEKLKSAGADIEAYDNGFRVCMRKRPVAVAFSASANGDSNMDKPAWVSGSPKRQLNSTTAMPSLPHARPA